MTALKHSVDNAQPTPTHGLMIALRANGNLQRWYTQNIDGLESRLLTPLVPGYSEAAQAENVCVLLHGSLNLVWCIKCFDVLPWEAFHTEKFREGCNPLCTKCQGV